MRVLKYFITGLLTLAFTLIAPQQTHAIFSPTIADQIALIKQHVFAARQLNGTGSVRHGATKIFDSFIVNSLKDADRERRKKRETTGLSSQFSAFRQEAKANVVSDAIESYGASFLLLFNYWNGEFITSCLRNDVMELEMFRDSVQTEAFRSALLLNRDQAAILWNDYHTIRNILRRLKISHETEPKLFFEDQDNYYGSACPLGGFWGEYEKAFENLERSWNVFATIGSGQSFRGLGNIWEMAQQNAKIKATQWIAKNKFKLSLGGAGGGSDTSLATLFSQEGIGASLERQWTVVKGMLGPMILIFDPDLYITAAQAIAMGLGADEDILDDNACAYYEKESGVWRGCGEDKLKKFKEGTCDNCRDKLKMSRTSQAISKDLDKQIADRTAMLVQMETTLEFNLEFNNVAQAATDDLKEKLENINTEIKRASEAFGDKAGKAVPSICNEMREILLKHCPNKGGDIPACK